MVQAARSVNPDVVVPKLREGRSYRAKRKASQVRHGRAAWVKGGPTIKAFLFPSP
jgi:hypothetical protein